jgi:hypothetical protein
MWMKRREKRIRRRNEALSYLTYLMVVVAVVKRRPEKDVAADLLMVPAVRVPAALLVDREGLVVKVAGKAEGDFLGLDLVFLGLSVDLACLVVVGEVTGTGLGRGSQGHQSGHTQHAETAEHNSWLLLGGSNLYAQVCGEMR